MSRVLVVDDDDTVAEVVGRYLANAGFEVDRAADGPSALVAAERNRPDLVVLDLMLPGFGGLELWRRMRERHPVPVIMLTALGEEADRIAGFETGADDYVTKPFSPRELVLRVQSVLRRNQARDGGASGAGGAGGGPRGGLLRAGNLVVDVGARTVSRDGAPVSLTVREFDLLAYLLSRPGRAFSRTRLMADVWGWTYGDSSTVTVHVRRLREKVEADPTSPRLLVTVWGVGYRCELPDAAYLGAG